MQLSIVTVTYNSLNTLQTAYDSLLIQTFVNWEWVVQDGKSTDGTLEWLMSLSDDRVRWASESDSGIYDALNKGLSRASGDWIGLLHSDDLYAGPDVLEKVMSACEGHQAIYGDLKYVHQNDTSKVLRYWRSSEYQLKKIQRGWMPPHPTLFLKKDVYLLVGDFDTCYKIAADYDYVLRVFSINKLNTKYLPIVIMLMRQGGVSSKISNLFRKSSEDFQIIKKHKLKLPYIVLLMKIFTKLNQF